GVRARQPLVELNNKTMPPAGPVCQACAHMLLGARVNAAGGAQRLRPLGCRYCSLELGKFEVATSEQSLEGRSRRFVFQFHPGAFSKLTLLEAELLYWRHNQASPFVENSRS